MCILHILNITFLLTINDNSYYSSTVFNFVTHRDHTYKNARYGWALELWVKDEDDHDTFAVVIIMTEYIVEHVLKAITCHHLLLRVCTCDTIRGCATIKINHENKVFVLE